MLKNYFLTTLRSLLRKKLFVFINILGLGFAIALCIVAYLNWQFTHDWDKSQVNADHLYRVQFTHELDDREDHFAVAPVPLANLLRQNNPEIKATRFARDYVNLRIGEEVFTPSVAYADSSFVEMFSMEVKHGDISNFWKKGSLLISDELAVKYFGNDDVVGKPITQITQDGVREFEVGAVFKKWPLNSSFKFEVLLLWENKWHATEDWKEFCTTLLMSRDPQAADRISRQLQQYVEPQNIARRDLKVKEYYLRPFAGIRQFRGLNGNELSVGAPDAVVIVPSIMAVLLLLLACFNFTNTSIALSSQRLKEISIRKVLGGLKRQLVLQFLGENMFLCFLSFLAGLLIAEWMVPAYDNLWPWLELDFSYSRHAGILIFLFVLLLGTGLLAGSYPAVYISSFEPIAILRGKTKFGGTNWLTRTMLAFQFSISLVTIIFAVGFYHNANYQRDYDLGYATSGVISVWIGNEGDFNTYRDALSTNPGLLKIAGTSSHVSNSFYSGAVRYESIEKQVDMMDVGYDYPEAVDIKVIAGRNFIKDSRTDQVESVLVSEEFVKRFGWRDNPVGKRIVWHDTVQLFVVGVIKDIYVGSFFRPLGPMLIRYIPPEKYQQLIVRTTAEDVVTVNEYMRTQWRQVFPNRSYEGQYMDFQMSRTVETNNNVITIFGFIGFFAALMSGTGLFTLVSLTILKRLKEIGIRKVLGSSVLRLAGVISYEFIIILLFACLAGGAIGYVMVDFSLDAAWEYYEKVGPRTIGLSVGIMLLLALLTVGLKIVNAARMNPVQNLRSE